MTMPAPRMFSGVNEMKILGSKNHNHELIAPYHHQENRVLSPFEQFLKSLQTNGYAPNAVPDIAEAGRKEVKIPGKKFGTGIITEDGDVVQVVDEKPKFVSKLYSTVAYLLFVRRDTRYFVAIYIYMGV